MVRHCERSGFCMIARRMPVAKKGIGGIDQYTSLILHGGELKDVSLNNITVSGSNITIVDGGKFNKSFSFNGSNSYINLGINSVLNSYYWTVDWWENRTSPAGDGGPILAKYCSNQSGAGGMAIVWVEGGIPKIYLSNNGSSWNILSSMKIWDFTLGQWVHNAIVRNNGTLSFFKNGTKTSDMSVGTNLPYNNGLEYRINYYGTDTTYSKFKGKIEEFRVSSIARWTANFTPPASPYTR